MSKKSKSESKQKRLQEKRRIKESNKAKYAERARLGITKKSRRFKKKTGRKLVITVEHVHYCGNIGCDRCNPNKSF